MNIISLIILSLKDKIQIDYEYRVITLNERKQKVLLTAQRLFIEKGFPGTSVQDILDEAQISKGTFYNYFSSKNECLLAILDRAKNEVSIRRRELLIGQKVSNKEILSKQILVRMQVTREYNLLPIFESTVHSDDTDLKTFVKQQHFSELSWLANRLIDIYGENSSPYVSDCAVFLLGMMQHLLHVSKMDVSEEIDLTKLIPFVMRRIDSIIVDMMATGDVFLREDVFFIPPANSVVSKQDLLLQLTRFYNHSEQDMPSSGKQYLQFLIEELQLEEPRVFLLESVVRSFREAFVGTGYEGEVGGYAEDIWRYFEPLDNR